MIPVFLAVEFFLSCGFMKIEQKPTLGVSKA